MISSVQYCSFISEDLVELYRPTEKSCLTSLYASVSIFNVIVLKSLCRISGLLLSRTTSFSRMSEKAIKRRQVVDNISWDRIIVKVSN